MVKNSKYWRKRIKEGVNPTDFESAGEDQALRNAGTPFNKDGLNKSDDRERERDENEIEYQLKIFKKTSREAQEKTKDDPSEINVIKFADEPNATDKNSVRIMKDFIKKMDDWAQKNRDSRSSIPVKTTSTAFRPTQRERDDDENPTVDTHRKVADYKYDKED